MKIANILSKRIRSVTHGVDPSLDDGNIEILLDSGISVLVSIADYDFNLSWRTGNKVSIRRYQCTFGNYPEPSDWEFQHLNEFFLYELAHDRNIAVWCESKAVAGIIKESISAFFERGDVPLGIFIREKLATQPERSKAIPSMLTHCKACKEKRCLTDVMCHVASVRDAEHILQNGEILSAVQVRQKSGEELSKENRNAAGDPPDYFNYVMFTFGNCTAGDRLVMERKLEQSPSESELMHDFTPGVRFCFRYRDLVNHPGFRSDGYHYCKIRDRISLDERLLAVIAPESAKDSLINSSPPATREKLVFVKEPEYPDMYSWAHQAYMLASGESPSKS